MYEVWLNGQLTSVPMPSYQKPDINGFREGDHICLLRPFVSDVVSFEAGRTGVVLVIDTAPAQIRLARSASLCDVYVRGQGGRVIGVSVEALEIVRGKFDVTYDADSVSCSMRFSDGDRVEFDRSVGIGEAVYRAGTPGIIRFPQNPATRAKLAARSQYAVVLDTGDVEVVPGAILRLGS